MQVGDSLREITTGVRESICELAYCVVDSRDGIMSRFHLGQHSALEFRVRGDRGGCFEHFADSSVVRFCGTHFKKPND